MVVNELIIVHNPNCPSTSIAVIEFRKYISIYFQINFSEDDHIKQPRDFDDVDREAIHRTHVADLNNIADTAT